MWEDGLTNVRLPSHLHTLLVISKKLPFKTSLSLQITLFHKDQAFRDLLPHISYRSNVSKTIKSFHHSIYSICECHFTKSYHIHTLVQFRVQFINTFQETHLFIRPPLHTSPKHLQAHMFINSLIIYLTCIEIGNDAQENYLSLVIIYLSYSQI